jgi:hypothetical protein
MKVVLLAAATGVVCGTGVAGWRGWSAYPYWPIGEATSGFQAQAEGIADVIRARGQYEQDHAAAVAAMNAEKQLQIQRRVQQRQTYLAMQAARAAEVRARNEARREELARDPDAMTPRTLSSDQLDVETGAIAWPALLQRPQFDASRKELDALFEEWAAAGRSGRAFDLQPIVAAISRMREELRALIRSVDATTYLGARGFLDSLEMSARRPKGG